jgi:hypothetical protein
VEHKGSPSILRDSAYVRQSFIVSLERFEEDLASMIKDLENFAFNTREVLRNSHGALKILRKFCASHWVLPTVDCCLQAVRDVDEKLCYHGEGEQFDPY